jgi:hypothetical protein
VYLLYAIITHRSNKAINLIETVEIKMYTIKSTKFPKQKWDILENGKVVNSTYNSYKLACALLSQYQMVEKVYTRVAEIEASVCLFKARCDRETREASYATR